MFDKRCLIAEIGGNHGGDKEIALNLGLEAIANGADYVKYQILTANSLVNTKYSPERHKHFDKLTLSAKDYVDIAEKVIEAGGKFNSSIWDESSVDLFNDYMDFYKIGSGDLTNIKIINKIIETRKPIILSTGLTELQDLQRVVEHIVEKDSSYKNDSKLCIMQCTSLYPCPDSEVNLSVVPELSRLFPYASIGYSHHTKTMYPLELAYALGAKTIEFHYTYDRDVEGFRDHQLSLTKELLIDFNKKLSHIDEILGVNIKRVTDAEMAVGHVEEFRRGLFLKHDLKAGTIVTENDFVCLRPEVGIRAIDIESVVGKMLQKDTNALDKLDISFFS